MNYVLIKTSELTELLPLRCSYQTELDLQLAIQSIGLGSKGSNQTQYLNYGPQLQSPHLEAVIARFLPEIDYASLFMILNHEKLKTCIQSNVLLSHYQIPPTNHVMKTLERSTAWSDSTLNWLLQKKIKPHEISFLNLLSAAECNQLMESMGSSSLSKMDSLKLLETASELLLMKIDISAALNTQPWNEKTVVEIHALRYPKSFTFNPVKQIELKWPKNISTQTKRIQDKMGYQVQFFVSHPEELTQTLSQLEKVVPDWASKLEKLNS
ncbi:MAG: hypothetical protein JNL11_03785 [Bdellovibrionaceae bacterium]|nr:hypothetical protein [Pseudobdellovibrionaceae bacterium]